MSISERSAESETRSGGSLDFSAVFAVAPTAYLIVRADAPKWTILAVSDEYCRITHQRREQLIGRGTFEAFPESHDTESSGGQHNVRGSFENAVALGGRVVLPIQRYDLPPSSDGGAYEEHYWRMSSAPVGGVAGDELTVLHAVENVTDQVLAERAQRNALAAARTAEDRLRTVFAEAPVGVAVLRGPEHCYESANASYAALVGGRKLVNLTVREALPELEGHEIHDALDRVFSRAEVYKANQMLLRLDRLNDGVMSDGYFDFVYQPLVNSDGAVEGIAVIVTDVTAAALSRLEAEDRERSTAMLNSTLVSQQAELEALNVHLQEQATELELQAEEARTLSEELATANVQLRETAEAAAESEARFRTTANAAPVLIWTSGADKLYDWFNQAWLTFTGRAMQDELGEGWTVGIHPDDIEGCLGKYSESFDARERFSIEYRLRRSDGEYRWVLDTGTPRFDESGNFAGYIGSCVDVSEQRRAREAAENANRTKADFLAAMSHELRTPLNAISGYVQLMQMELHGSITDQQRVDLERIQRSQTVLSRLIEDVLSFARIDAGHVELQIADVPLEKLLDGVEALVAPQLEMKKLEYSYCHVEPSVMIHADRDKVEQIMLNLLSNAIKFTDAGKISVECEVAEREVLILVRDTGRGIPADKLQSIFEPFVQVESGLKRNVGGTGLGLAISRELARGMSGDITAASTPGSGSVFTLQLPRSG